MPVKRSQSIQGSSSLRDRNSPGAILAVLGEGPSLAGHHLRLSGGADNGNKSFLDKAAYVCLWLLVFVMPWENGITISWFGTVSRVVGFAALGVGLLAILDSRHIRAPAIEHLAMTLFVAWASLTYFWSFEPERTRIVSASLLQLLGMVWLIWQFAQTPRQLILLLRAFVLGTLVSSLAIILSYLTGPATGAEGSYYGRNTGLGFNPGDLALILALSLPISLYLAARDEGLRFHVRLYGVHLVLTISGILLVASRGGLIASSGALLMVPVAYSQLTRVQKTVCLATVAILALGLMFAVPQSSWSRLGTIRSEVSSGTLNERTMIWQAGWEVFGQSPFLGIGAAAFAPCVEHALGMSFYGANTHSGGPANAELVAHNTFISVLVEQGVIGFALFVGILLTLLLAAWRFTGTDRAFWLSLLMTWTIGISSLTWESRKPSWFIFGVLVTVAGARVPCKPRGNDSEGAPQADFGEARRLVADRTAEFGAY